MANTETSRACIRDYARLLINEHAPLRAFATYFSPDLIQHDPDIGDGHHGDQEFLEERREADPDSYLGEDQYATVVHNIMADGDLVAIKSHVFISPADQGRVFVDIWRVADRKFVEHWSAIETIPEDSPNPLKMWCGTGADYAGAAAAGNTVDAPVCGGPGDPARREKSLATVRAYTSMLQDRSRIAEAVERYVADDFTEYCPRLGQGKAALVEHLGACAARGETFREARFLADGELVLVHGLATGPEQPIGYSQMHLFRVADGRIVAHWSVRQHIPSYSVAGRSMVDGPLEPGRRAGKPEHAAQAH